MGATRGRPARRPAGWVSIHAPVWVRPASIPNSAKISRFNSRTRVGATGRFLRLIEKFTVSIHAPVWVRPRPGLRLIIFSWFQFTHPCGCDMPLSFQSTPLKRFNSRTRVGATSTGFIVMRKAAVSIHAPVWVRLAIATTALTKILFQFTHPCGCDTRHTRRSR